MRHAIRTSVRVLVTTFSIAAIVIGFAQGGNPFVHPVGGAGSIMSFVGIIVLCGYWSLAWCSWYSRLTVTQLAAAKTPQPHSADTGPFGYVNGADTGNDVALQRTIPVPTS
jgi:hypothetical protein